MGAVPFAFGELALIWETGWCAIIACVDVEGADSAVDWCYGRRVERWDVLGRCGAVWADVRGGDVECDGRHGEI